MKNKVLNILKILFFVLIPSIGIILFSGIMELNYISLICLSIIFSTFVLFKKNEKIKIDRNKKLYFILFSLLISLFYVFGTIIDINKNIFFYNILIEKIFINLFYIYSFTIYFNFIFTLLYACFKNNKVKQEKIKKHLYIIVFITLLLVWITYYVNFYPGLTSPDSLFQWCQSLGDCLLTNHHPVIHTLLIKCFSFINSSNLGVSLYSFFQLIFMDIICTYLIYFVSKNLNSKKLLVLSLVFFSVVPIFGFYSVTMWKDVIFALLGLLMIIKIYEFVTKSNIKFKSAFITSILAFCVSLFRTNGIYIMLVLVIIMLLFLKGKRKQIIYIFLIPIIFAFLIIKPLFSYLEIKSGNFVENLGIPLRQLGGVISKEYEIDEDDIKYIEKIVPFETIKNKYTPETVDFLKFSSDFNDDFLNNNKSKFLKIWFKYLKRYPIEYIQIYLKSTYGFWYPEAQGYIAVRWDIEKNNYELESKNKIDETIQVKYFNYFYNTPIIKYFLSDAFYLWCLLFTIFVSLISKKFKLVIPLLFPFFTWLSVMIASPANYQPRYTFILYCSFPFVVFILKKVFEDEKR